MRILKAYTDAGAMGGNSFGLIPSKNEQQEKRQDKEQIKDSGDSVRISAEAQELLENRNTETLDINAQDATYDQYGNVTRHVNALSRDLASLTRAAYPAGPALSGKINFIRSQLGSLRAQV